MLELLLNKLTPDSLPLNRIVAFLAPYTATLEGALATWLLTHLHFLSLLHISHDKLTSYIGQGVIFIATAGISWLGRQKWLTGHQGWTDSMAQIVQMTASYETLPPGGADALGLVSATSAAGNPPIPEGADTSADRVDIPANPDV